MDLPWHQVDFSGMEADARPTRLNTCGIHRSDARWRLGPERTRTWTDLDLWYLVDGTGMVVTPEGNFPLRPGTCLILRGGESYDIRPDRGRRLHHAFAHFDYLDGGGNPLPPTGDLPARHRHLADVAILAGICERMAEAFLHGRTTAAQTWLDAALLEVARADRAQGRTDPRSAHVEAWCAAVRAEPGRPWSLAAWAAADGRSADHLARSFRRHMGCAPRAWLTRIRFARARSLLLDSDLPIAAIAAQVGYADAHFFSRHFHRHHGRPPSAFRRGT